MFAQFNLNRKAWQSIVKDVYSIVFEKDDSDEILYQKYKTLLHLRHNQLHLFVSETLGEVASLDISQKISSVYPEIDFRGLANLTPDIVISTQECELIIDVTINTEVETQRKLKQIKYDRIRDVLVSHGLAAKVLIISVEPSLSNIKEELNVLERFGFSINELVFAEFNSLNYYTSQKLNKMRNLIPNSYFERKEEMLPFRREFLSKSEYEVITSKSDMSRIKFEMSKDDCYNTFIHLYNDPEVYEKLVDKEHKLENFYHAFNLLSEDEPSSYCAAKPSFHFIYVPHLKLNNFENDFNLKSDQQNVLNILNVVKYVSSNDSSVSLCNLIFEQLIDALSDPVELSLFNTGFFTGTYEGDVALKENYRFKNSIETPIEGISIRRQVLMNLRQSAPLIERSHQLRIKREIKVSEFLNDSGVRFSEHHPDGRQYNKPMSCTPECSADFERFIKLICEKPNSLVKYDPLWDLPVGEDSVTAKLLKDEFREEYRTFYRLISKTHALNMSYHTMIASDQAMHYASLNTKEGSFYMVNTGVPNVLHIFQGGSLSRGRDIGQPFFSVAITSDPRWANSVWGKHKVYNIKLNSQDAFVIITGWRRLQNHKLMLLRDQFYSCQSTGFDTFSRNRSLQNSKLTEYLKFIYIFRTLVGQCTSQRVAEFLMDVRYIIMACYSDYTNVAKLITEKFGHHYPNSFSRWIVNQLKKKVRPISEAYLQADSFSGTTPIFIGNERLQSSLGGKIKFPSLWSDYTLRSVQDLFDELFVYVHTGKEPSSLFYEGVKSMNTILKFQSEFEALSENEKIGIHTVDTFKRFLLSGKLVGCWSDFIYQSSKSLSESINGSVLKKKIALSTNCEVLSDIESTKACLPEYELTKDLKYSDYIDKTTSKKNASKRLKKDNNIKKMLELRGEKILNENNMDKMIFKDIHGSSVVENSNFTLRAKVHDLCHDFILRFPEKSQCVLDVAHWNMFDNKNRVDSHICIKAQFGAKREFYVVNFGAKCMVRMYENIFKSIASVLPQEMISSPGDEKMLHMYNNVNEVIKSEKSNSGETFFVNGDCTKWSACETMASFWSMVSGFSSCIGESETEYCKAVLEAWTKKHIFIPDDILRGVRFVTEKTKYINSGRYVLSSQNFLQGMFNYSSSVKAVAATEYAIYCWNRLYGSSKPIIVRHLEHSDDYCLIVRVTNRQHFLDFRVMHKLSQKLHGINDSDKKTNCQRFIMEFISLMCFNGQMAYPHIKKTKEAGINVAGTGYQHDCMNVISRSSEAVRVGVPQCSAYVLQMLQGINIYRKYSLCPGQRNSHQTSNDPYNCPIELFGLPDCLPLLYLGTSGDSNNYRLFLYAKQNSKIFKGLYVLSQHKTNDMESNIQSDLLPTFYTARYFYKKGGNKIRKIKQKIGWDFAKINEYREKNPEYQLIKPRHTQNYKLWLEAMYYNTSFNAAYSQASRQMINLRLSFFSSGKCLVNLNNELERVTIRDYIKHVRDEIDKFSIAFFDDNSDDLERLITNSDPLLKAFYEMLNNSRLLVIDKPPPSAIVNRLPKPFKFLRLENQLGSVIQYHVSPENFQLDRRFNKGKASLDRDASILIDLFGKEMMQPDSILKLNKMLKSQNASRMVVLGFSRESGRNQIENLVSYLENGINYRNQFQVISSQETTLINPFTKEIIYSRDYMFTSNKFNIILENMTLALYILKIKMGISISEISSIFKDTKCFGEAKSAFELLNGMDMELDTHSCIFHKRMFVILKYLICGSPIEMYEFSKNSYTVLHHYLNQIEISTSLGSNISEAVAFSFRHQFFIGILTNSGSIAVLCEDATITKALLTYNIAERLFGKITQNEFEDRLSGKLHSTEYNLDQSTVDLLKPGNYSFYSKVGNIITKTQSVSNSLAVILNYRSIKYKCKNELMISAKPEIKEDSLSVWTGNVKLFNLPLWPCGSNVIIELPSKLINGFDIQSFNVPKLMYSYIRQSEIPFALGKDDSKHFLLKNSKIFKLSNHFKPNVELSTPVITTNVNLARSFNFDFSRFKIKGNEFGDIISGAQSGKNTTERNDSLNEFNEKLETGTVEKTQNYSDNETYETDESEENIPKFSGLTLSKFKLNFSLPGLQEDEEQQNDSDECDFNLPFRPIGQNVGFNSSDEDYYDEDDFGPQISQDYDLVNAQINEMRMNQCLPELTLEEEEYHSDDSPIENEEINDYIAISKSYIQLHTPDNTTSSYSVNYLAALPSVELYLLRCWIGYDIHSWIRDPYNVFCIIRILAEVEARKYILSSFENSILLYLYGECMNVLVSGELNSIEFKVGNNLVFFRNKTLYMRKQRVYFTKSRAKKALKKIKNSEMIEQDDMFIIQYDNVETSDLFKKTSIVFNLKGRKVWNVVHDIVTDLELNSLLE